MASLPLSIESLSAVKNALRDELPDARSSHLTEALAAALGRRTHAALLSELPAFQDDPPIELLDDERFVQRLKDFGYPSDSEFSFEQVDCDDIISTVPASALTIKYMSARDKAWRNIMVYAINEGIRRKLFSLRPDDNRWPSADKREGIMFDFTIPNGMPARAYVDDISFGELSIHVAVIPTDDRKILQAFNAGFNAGDAVATGWLEREHGAWLQSSPDRFHCRNYLLKELAALEVEPLGYGDRGRIIK